MSTTEHAQDDDLVRRVRRRTRPFRHFEGSLLVARPFDGSIVNLSGIARDIWSRSEDWIGVDELSSVLTATEQDDEEFLNALALLIEHDLVDTS